MKKNLLVVVIAILALAAWYAFNRTTPASNTRTRDRETPLAVLDKSETITQAAPEDSEDGDETAEDESEDTEVDTVVETADSEDGDEPESSREDEEEKLVEEFDSETDAWREPKEVTMDSVYKFVEKFKKIPENRKEESLQRALNLVPDDNIMLLAGILMDKSLPDEYVELVFNDVLNRNDDVKKPVLELIYKDKSHHCWSDVAWIFDITGEKKKQD